MIFINNNKGIEYDMKTLSKGIKLQCKKENRKFKNSYKISVRGGYPTICIGHKHFRIHKLIGRIVYGEYGKKYCIHHKDCNKLNNDIDNLQLLTYSEHIKIHNIHKNVCKEKLKQNAMKGIQKITRHDVTKENVLSLRGKGMTYKSIAKTLNCSYNTVWRRLKDWSDEQ